MGQLYIEREVSNIVTIVVHDNNVEQALRVLKKKIAIMKNRPKRKPVKQRSAFVVHAKCVGNVLVLKDINPLLKCYKLLLGYCLKRSFFTKNLTFENF